MMNDETQEFYKHAFEVARRSIIAGGPIEIKPDTYITDPKQQAADYMKELAMTKTSQRVRAIS